LIQAPLTVVGIDFSPSSSVALRQALRLASGSTRKVRVVHAIDDPAAGVQRAELEAWTEHARWAWGEFSRDVPGAESIPFDIELGGRARAILANARAHGADLLAFGAFGDRRPDVGFGTVATTCVRHAHCDVLLMRDTQAGAFRRVVAGVDFSEGSASALRRAAAIAQHDAAELRVLHTFEPPWRRMHYRAPTPKTSPAEQAEHRRGLEARVREFVRETLSGGEASGREVELARVDVVDAPAHRSGIVEHAETIGADLVVLGTRGHTNLRDLLLGSTAEKVLAESRCSVLAVRT
jgi:nucleotide-binding universal stress UspA family protein